MRREELTEKILDIKRDKGWTFGDGIMSTIDFDMAIERQPNPKGDRVKLTMSGKFQPYKYYGNEPGIADSGVKES